MLDWRMASSRKPFLNKADAQTASDLRSQMVKDLLIKESAATDAKTARLKALRMAKEAEEAVARAAAPKPPPKPAKRSTRAS